MNRSAMKHWYYASAAAVSALAILAVALVPWSWYHA
jgi:hypothetical protein